MKVVSLLSKELLLMLFIIISSSLYSQKKPADIILMPNGKELVTESIQSVIDMCAGEGGGEVHYSEGIYYSGTLELKSNVVLQLDKGSSLRGSDNYKNYINDAFIFGKDVSDFAIQGEGTIDGVDCYNPLGEEGFRGPHCIRLINCKNFTLKEFTIINSANWAINCRYCSCAFLDRISIRGGHDGLHTRFCDNFRVNGCDSRTGDDTLRKFNLYIARSSFSFREGAEQNPDIFEGVKLFTTSFFTATNFNKVELQDVTFKKNGIYPVLNCSSGNSVLLNKVEFKTVNSSIPYLLEKITEEKKKT